MKERLLAINPHADIGVHNVFLTPANIQQIVTGADMAINALDFQSEVPFLFDALCQEQQIPVLHPYNIGWATVVFVVMPGGPGLDTISNSYEGFEKAVVGYLLDRLPAGPREWIAKVLSDYAQQGEGAPPPQLSVASALAAGTCTNIMYRLVNGLPVRSFPDFYFVSI